MNTRATATEEVTIGVKKMVRNRCEPFPITESRMYANKKAPGRIKAWETIQITAVFQRAFQNKLS